MAQAYRPTETGLRLAVRVTPRARRAAVEGLRAGPDGPVLAVTVTAAPEDGKANAAVVTVLAKALDLPKSAVTIVQGAKSRNKTVALDGPTDTLSRKLEALISGVPHG